LDHVGGYNFIVEIDGVAAGSFKAVDGLEASVEVIEFQDGADLLPRKRPGRTKFNDVTLKKGYIVNKQLQEWWENVRNGKYDRRAVSIILNDNTATEIMRWNLFEAFISKWKMSGFDGKGNDVLQEEVTLSFENMQIGG
jgi:phage tail-like protein